jgi:hypothetical protein
MENLSQQFQISRAGSLRNNPPRRVFGEVSTKSVVKPPT